MQNTSQGEVFCGIESNSIEVVMRSLLAASLVVFLGFLPAQANEALRTVARAKGWHTDYATARAEARRTGKPLFLVFRCEP